MRRCKEGSTPRESEDGYSISVDRESRFPCLLRGVEVYEILQRVEPRKRTRELTCPGALLHIHPVNLCRQLLFGKLQSIHLRTDSVRGLVIYRECPRFLVYLR